MKLDPDLIRIILLKIEEKPPGDGPHHMEIEGYDHKLVIEHMRLLRDAAFIRAESMGVDFWPHDLTWEGHKFLNNIRDESVWKETKKHTYERVISASIDVLTSVATMIIHSKLGLN